jgi:hypothetical protein
MRLILRSERVDSGEAEFQRQPTERREVGVQPNAFDTTDAESGKAEVVLEASELTLY